jgi:hypothetical protein
MSDSGDCPQSWIDCSTRHGRWARPPCLWTRVGSRPTAQRLYSSRGFVERSPYEGTEIPPRLQHLWIFFERTAALA